MSEPIANGSQGTPRPTACHFGSFPKSEAYSRNRCLALALERAGWRVSECRIAPAVTGAGAIGSRPGLVAGARLLGRVLRGWLRLARLHAAAGPYDLLVVGYPAHLDVVPAALLGWLRRRPVVMDAFLGLHETLVEDRRLVAPGGVRERLLCAVEWCLLRLPHRVLMDTPEHARWLAGRYGLAADRVAAVPVGIDEDTWRPSPLPPEELPFRVAVWSTFIPLHAMETIAQAAALLGNRGADVEIAVIGDGQTAERFQTIVDEVRPSGLYWRRELIPVADCAAAAARAHCCLGVFGAGAKAARVIPYKVTQALAAGRPVITADTPAARSVLLDGRDALLVPPADPPALAAAICRLAADRVLCERLAANARPAYEARLGLRAMTAAVFEAVADYMPEPGRRARAR